MPSIDWNSPWTIAIVLSLALNAGLFVAVVGLVVRKVKSNVRKDLQALSNWAKKMGFSSNVTDVLDDAASGDLAAAAGAEVRAVKYFSNPANAGTELSSVIATVHNDKTIGPALDAAYSKLMAGGTASDIAPSLTTAITAGRASLPVPQIVQDFQTLQSKGLATLQNLQAALGANTAPQVAAQVAPIVAAAHAAGVASVAAPPVAPIVAPLAAAAGAIHVVVSQANPTPPSSAPAEKPASDSAAPKT